MCQDSANVLLQNTNNHWDTFTFSTAWDVGILEAYQKCWQHQHTPDRHKHLQGNVQRMSKGASCFAVCKPHLSFLTCQAPKMRAAVVRMVLHIFTRTICSTACPFAVNYTSKEKCFQTALASSECKYRPIPCQYISSTNASFTNILLCYITLLLYIYTIISHVSVADASEQRQPGKHITLLCYLWSLYKWKSMLAAYCSPWKL